MSRITIFVDKLSPNGLGGKTSDKRKIEYILACYSLSFEKIFNQVKSDVDLPSGAFHAGRYVAFYWIDSDLKRTNLTLVDYAIDLDENFDDFADALSPQAVQGYHTLSEIIKQKNESELSEVILSDKDDDFEIAYRNYLNFKK